MNTVYVFGAGASIHAGYPLASKMGEGLLDFMLAYPIDIYRESAQLITDSFGKCPNVEDLITEVEAGIDSLKNAEGREFEGFWNGLTACPSGSFGFQSQRSAPAPRSSTLIRSQSVFYSPEKTIADCFKYRNKVGLDIAIEALRTYRERHKRPNRRALIHYAQVCRVEKIMRPYLEAIL